MPQLRLNLLRISDKPFIDNILSSRETILSAYTFVSHYIWSDHFRYYWGIIENDFFLFARYDHYMYMPIPPVSCGNSVTYSNMRDKIGGLLTINPSFPLSLSPQAAGGELESGIMAKLISIENIDDLQKESFISAGFKLRPGEEEFVYLREDLSHLKGDPYKSKRAMYNNFVKHFKYQYVPFSPLFADGCHKLYNHWARQKKGETDDTFSHALMEDAAPAHWRTIKHYRALDLKGRVVLINNRVEAYIFGFARKDTFYVLMEVANPEIRGLAQFIFREFCREMEGYTYVNTLGDSGLENLRRVKLSYRPYKIVPSYSAYLL